MIGSRRTVRASAIAALTVVLAACGGGGTGSDAPSGASEDDFCAAYNSLFDSILADVDGEASEEDQAKQIVAGLKKWSKGLLEVGTPEEIPDDAREGFELSMESIGELDDNSSPEDFDSLGGSFSEEDQSAGDAFDAYATDTCGSLLGGGGTGLPDQG